jgi:large subunit ribosomal protein L30
LAARLRITWKKSAIGYKNNQKRTIEALGLKRLGQSVEQADNRAVRGMITKVRHLVEVTEVDGASPAEASKE